MAETATLALDIKNNVVAGVFFTENKRVLTVLAAHCSFLAEPSSPAGLEAAVAEVVERCGARGARCLVTFGAEHFNYRSMHLPFEDSKKVRSVLPFEIEDNASFNDEPFLFDYLLGPGTEEGTEVFAALIKKAALIEWLALLQTAGLDPEIVTISGLPAAFNMCRYAEATPQSYALLQIGLTRATFQLIRNGEVKAIRSLPHNLRQQGGIRYAAETGKLEVADAGQLEAAAGDLAAGVANTLFALKADDAEAEEVPVGVGGLLGALESCRRVVLEALPAPALNTDWLQAIAIENLQSAAAPWPHGSLDDAIALACCSPRDRERMNFRKDELAFKSGRGRFPLPLRVALASLLALAVAVVLYQGFDYQRMKQKRNKLADRIVSQFQELVPGTQPGKEPVKEMQIKVNKLRETAAVDSNRDTSLTTVKLLADISERIPEAIPVSLERFIYDRKTIRIKGLTDNFNSVDMMKKALEQSPHFAMVSIGSANIDPKEQGVRFELKLDL